MGIETVRSEVTELRICVRNCGFSEREEQKLLRFIDGLAYKTFIELPEALAQLKTSLDRIAELEARVQIDNNKEANNG